MYNCRHISFAPLTFFARRCCSALRRIRRHWPCLHLLNLYHLSPSPPRRALRKRTFEVAVVEVIVCILRLFSQHGHINLGPITCAIWCYCDCCAGDALPTLLQVTEKAFAASAVLCVLFFVAVMAHINRTVLFCASKCNQCLPQMLQKLFVCKQAVGFSSRRVRCLSLLSPLFFWQTLTALLMNQ